MFGDNLSFISDTTIAATRTQGCNMRDKFRTNFLIVAPAALLTLLAYIFTNQQAISYSDAGDPIMGGTVMKLSKTDGSISDAYIYYCDTSDDAGEGGGAYCPTSGK